MRWNCGIAEVAWRRVGVRAELLCPGRREQGVLAQRLAEVSRARDVLHDAVKREQTLLRDERRVELRVVVPRVRRREDRAQGIERLVAGHAGDLRGVGRVEAGRAGRLRRVGAIHLRPQRDDERLVHRDAHLVADGRLPVREEGRCAGEADARDRQHELLGGAQRGQVVERRRRLGAVRRPDRHERPVGEVGRLQLRRRGRAARGRTVEAPGGRVLVPVEGAQQQVVQRDAARRIVDDRIGRAAGDVHVVRRDVGVVPVHVARARRIERVGDGDGARRGLDDDGRLRVGLLEPVGDLAVVVHLPNVEEGVELLHRRRHHELGRRRRVRERPALREERQHREREALLGVLHEQRRRRRVDVDLLWKGLVGEIHGGDLRLLEGELEEALHLRLVARQLEPARDEPLELRPVGGHHLHLGIRRRQAHENVLHLRDIGGGRGRREGRRVDGRCRPISWRDAHGPSAAAWSSRRAGRASAQTRAGERPEEGKEEEDRAGLRPAEDLRRHGPIMTAKAALQTLFHRPKL